jgi:flagellar protein FliS
MNTSQLASYQNARTTLQKTRQIVLLYDAAIRFVQQAKQAVEARDFETRYERLQKVSNILSGLHASLDYDNGGEISVVLSSFYTGLDLKVISVNRTNNIEDCDYIIDELKNMRDSWEKIDLAMDVAPRTAAEQVAKVSEKVEMAFEGADFSA